MTNSPSTEKTTLSTHFPRLRIALSSCLSGTECRYNGGHAQDDFVRNHLANYADFFKFCPEAAVIGTPRETIRLVGINGAIHVRGSTSNTDYTEGLQHYTDTTINKLQQQSLDGAVVKSRSPSCGLERIKVYRESGEWYGTKDPMDQGIFTRNLQQKISHIAIEEEGRLQDAWLRENFMLQVFSLARLREFLSSSPAVSELQQFHRDHKYLLLSKHEPFYRDMGRLVAKARSNNLQDSLDQYRDHFYAIMAHKSRRSTMINVLEHMYGYFKLQVTPTEKAFFRETLHEFRQGIVPLIAVIKILQQFIHHYGSDYLQTQVILHPYPSELALRSDIRAYR